MKSATTKLRWNDYAPLDEEQENLLFSNCFTHYTALHKTVGDFEEVERRLNSLVDSLGDTLWLI